MPYPSQPDTSIGVGDLVRSYDLDGIDDCYIEGTVVSIEHMDGCDRYRIAINARVLGGFGDELPREASFVFPPVNGTPTSMGGITRGVERITEGSAA